MEMRIANRRSGPCQVPLHAMKAHQARAYICHEREKFTFYALDWLALLLLLITPNFGPALLMMIECMQLGWLLAKRFFLPSWRLFRSAASEWPAAQTDTEARAKNPPASAPVLH